MYKIVFMRHGESTWNLDNRFTGWTDVDLTEKGVNEARAAGQILKQEGFTFDVAYTSVLKRAIRTLWLALDEMDMMYLRTSYLQCIYIIFTFQYQRHHVPLSFLLSFYI